MYTHTHLHTHTHTHTHTTGGNFALSTSKPRLEIVEQPKAVSTNINDTITISFVYSQYTVSVYDTFVED